MPFTGYALPKGRGPLRCRGPGIENWRLDVIRTPQFARTSSGAAIVARYGLCALRFSRPARRNLMRRERGEQASRLGVRGLAGQDRLKLAARTVEVPGLNVGLRERHSGVGLVVAPDRDLQLVDRVGDLAGAQVKPSEQQMRLAFVRRQIDRAPQLRNRFRVTLGLIQASSAFEMKGRHVALISLFGGGDGRVDSWRARRVKLRFDTFQVRRNHIRT